MTDSYFCRSCGARYIPGESRYCTKCGKPIQTKERLADDVNAIQNEPKPYETLRIVSGFIVLIGWIVILVGWMAAFAIGTYYENVLSQLISDAGPYSLIRNQSYFATAIIGVFTTIQGLFMIASGQVFMALLDIRNDTHTTLRIVARLGLAMVERQEQPSAPKESVS